MTSETTAINPVEAKNAIITAFHFDETAAKGVYVVGNDSNGSKPTLTLTKPEYHDSDLKVLTGLGWKLAMLWSKSNTSKLSGLFTYEGVKTASDDNRGA